MKKNIGTKWVESKMFSHRYLCHRSVHFFKATTTSDVTESIVTEEEGATQHIVHQTSQKNGLTLWPECYPGHAEPLRATVSPNCLKLIHQK